MIIQNIDVEGYWKIKIIYNAYLGYYNTGFTQSNYKKKVSIVGISLSTSCEQFINTMIHELRHVVDDICKYYNIDLDSEDAAYLTGYLIQKMYRFYKKNINC